MKEKTSPWFKVFALCTAIGLGGVYVWRQQQKAAPQIDKPDDRTVLSGSKSKVIEPTPLPVDHEEADRVLMSSSKSGVFKLAHEKEQGRTLMPGSKGGLIELKPGDEKDRVLLPSSKSIPMPIFRERRITPEEQPKPVKP
jgi:hypothetical protein